MFDLQAEIDNTTTGVIQLPYNDPVRCGQLRINREIRIEGPTMLSGLLEVNSIHIGCRGSVQLNNMRITGPGSGFGVDYDYAFSARIDNVLMEGFDYTMHYRAGNCWSISNSRLCPNKMGALVKNEENGDEGDWFITGTTFECAKGIAGDAGVLVESSGGGRLVNNKFLGFKFPVLLQTKCVSSVFIVAACSIENYSHMGVAGRVVDGSYDKVSITGCEFMSPTGGAVSMNHVDKVAVFGNVSNVALPFFQKDGVDQSIVGMNI